MKVIGQSWEGRDLKIVKICRGGCGNKPAIWIDGGGYGDILKLCHSAREGGRKYKKFVCLSDPISEFSKSSARPLTENYQFRH